MKHFLLFCISFMITTTGCAMYRSGAASALTDDFADVGKISSLVYDLMSPDEIDFLGKEHMMHDLRIAKGLVKAKLEEEDIWLKQEAAGYPTILKKWHATIEDNVNPGDAYNKDERRFKQWVARKDKNFPHYCAHFLVPGKLAIGEGPFNGILSAYEHSATPDKYDNTLRFLDAIMANNITKVISIGAPWEETGGKAGGHKFTVLFGPEEEKLIVGPYRLESTLVKKGEHINEYLLTIYGPTPPYKVYVEHLFNIRDGNPFPEENLEIMDFLTDIVRYLKDEKHKVFVHCAAGLGRSGILAGITYLGLNQDMLVGKSDIDLAKFIFEMWNNFNSIRPGTASGKKQISSIIGLYLRLYTRSP